MGVAVRLGTEQARHELLRRHLEAEDADHLAVLEGGILSQMRRELEVWALPGAIPLNIEVDVLAKYVERMVGGAR